MKILVIGSGAREHALVHSLKKDENVEVFCAPGNAGISQQVSTFPLDVLNSESVVALATELRSDLVVIGPEGPLVAGVADALRSAGFPVFGPNKSAAEIEGSKAFAKDVMTSAGVPTAKSQTCRNQEEVESALIEFGAPHVVKDDGLAAGKGVVVTDDYAVALAHALACIEGRANGAVVIEEYLAGPEISLFGVTDGKTVVPLSPAQDFKRALDDDAGPNTGGMGAYSPLDWAPADLVAETVTKVLQPTIDELARRGKPFSGLLYAGLALTPAGIKVIEFNARFGDPETQVVLARLQSPLSELLYAAATEQLASLPELIWSTDHAVTVVLAAAGYPEAPELGSEIFGLASLAEDSAYVLHAGTKISETGSMQTSGGRVLSVTATGTNLAQARMNAYETIEKIDFAGRQYRTDIALRAARGEITVS
ncbi:MAG: phosphoribosylamine--glycine ligase [Actinomycetales bacterium]|nr:phosphoribosylamine--glycine ligase [Actinomycetales bacterium]